MRPPRDEGLRLRRAVEDVVVNDNCSGCGGCTLLTPALSMQLDVAGFLRPVWQDAAGPTPRSAAADFATICPGVRVTAPPAAGRRSQPVLGGYVSLWSAWATDEELRFAGSSGGVLSALSSWLLATGRSSSVIGAAQTETRTDRTRTAVSVLRSREDVLAAAGSRYAPVASMTGMRSAAEGTVFIGKPCETYAASQLAGLAAGAPADRQPAPILLSFFCAGVPSQHATDGLVAELGVDPAAVDQLRYRGNGWPGQFAVTGKDGSRAAVSYEQSWGAHLGKQLQARCRICPDGTGGHADVAVGDYWATDERGYPKFDDGAGVSVAIARTQRGHQLLLAAQEAGVLSLQPIDADSVAAIQPFQTLRRRTLPGRLVGRRLAGKSVPRFRRYQLIRMAVRYPRQNVHYLRGTYARARRTVAALGREAGDRNG